MTQQAFVIRISPSGDDKVSVALAENQLIIGWSKAEGLLESSLSWVTFRSIISTTYYSKADSLRKAGAASGHMWRFIRAMSVGDLVVVPHGAKFYVAEIQSDASYDSALISDDTAYRRNVVWLNDKKPIKREFAKSALISRMKIQGTSADATDLLADIKECLDVAVKNEKPTFQADLQARLVHQTLDELRNGRMDSFGFEQLIKTVLLGLGAKEACVVARSQDKGADILASFLVAGAFRQVVAVQAKHWQPKPPVGKDVVEQLIQGIEAESADLGMVITSGSISQEAVLAAERYFEDKGIKIELVDGEQFAKLMIEHGITGI